MTDHDFGCGQGEERRGRRRHGGHRHRRKERVLHTRVSENLAEDIRRIAIDCDDSGRVVLLVVHEHLGASLIAKAITLR